mmetsp:Transcript_2806/g.9075  ORF Transcript_2806/g.9075 Transcript_2806/m.9075 type:complete len:251 (+) Transcript_2806:590-1342(+)
MTIGEHSCHQPYIPDGKSKPQYSSRSLSFDASSIHEMPTSNPASMSWLSELYLFLALVSPLVLGMDANEADGEEIEELEEEAAGGDEVGVGKAVRAALAGRFSSLLASIAACTTSGSRCPISPIISALVRFPPATLGRSATLTANCWASATSSSRFSFWAIEAVVPTSILLGERHAAAGGAFSLRSGTRTLNVAADDEDDEVLASKSGEPYALVATMPVTRSFGLYTVTITSPTRNTRYSPTAKPCDMTA